MGFKSSGNDNMTFMNETTTGSLVFGANSTTALVVAANGNLGIGSAVPNAKIDVIGSGVFSGTVTAGGTVLTFTGQHMNKVDGVHSSNVEDKVGLIVSANMNEYVSLNGELTRGQGAISINEALPLLSLASKNKDRTVFGVVSGGEISDTSATTRHQQFGSLVSTNDKEVGDFRVVVNSVGEGGMWVCNQNGSISSGDFVTSCTVPGYGMKQESEFLANYTVAKVTMDCNFEPIVNNKRHIKKKNFDGVMVNVLDVNGELIWEESGVPEYAYKMRYLTGTGSILTKDEYDIKKKKGESVYVAAFVGVTYHCG